MLAAASRHARPTAGSGNRIRSLLTASGITTGYSISTTNGYRYGYSYGHRISYSNRHTRTCPSSLFSIKSFLSDSSSSSPSGRVTNPFIPLPNSKVDGKALFSTSAKTDDDGNQKNQKSSTTVAKSSPGGGQIADIKILKSLASYIWMKDNLEFQFRVVAALFLLVGAKVVNVQVPFLFKLAVDWLNTATGTAGVVASNPTVMALFATPVAVLIGYGIARSGASAFNELRTALFSKVALRTIRLVSRKVFSHLHDLDLQYHLSRETGGLSRIIDRGSRAINFILSAMVFNVVPTVLEISMVSGILAYKFGAPFAWITSLSVAAYVVFTLSITQWRTKFRKAMNKADNDASTRQIDSLINYETVKYFNNEGYETDHYDKYLKRYEDAALKTQHSLALLNFGQNAIFSAALSTAMVLCSHGIMNGTMTVGDLEKADIRDKENAKPLRFNGGRIQFENIKIDDQDIRDVTLESLRKSIGVVPQDTVLFNDTIFHNIHYGRLSSTEEEVYEAARKAAIHDTIMSFPEKYSTVVGERGLKLSGGEKQRVALARAFLKAPAILLCDEATSALDSTTEAEILSALKSLSTNRTSIFIAHRLTTAMQCDEIIVLENGKVVEHGPHEVLLANAGRYAQLWGQQNNTIDAIDTAIKLGA
ncbi:hypothetical protein TSUD_246630 [Trifolium subterraneum]|uniref:ABC transmembrane type-1 domain-containing protein n=1 Tax=Trifolium subterraneum TaxID=3900 RepID=A0A2Z6PMC9_TRISU|nr:hypothetical protein TSUD_246630 [Trifolium subterraneum]